MVRVCSFPGCFNQMKLSYRRSVTFHKLPVQDPERLLLWLNALRRDILTVNVDGLRVCSEHFSPEDFRFTKGRALLKTTAVPTESQLKTEQQDSKPPGQIGDTVSDDVQPGEDSLSNNTPETSTATMEKAPLQHIVDEEAILQLMKNCPMCDRKCRCTKHNRGPYFIVYQSCYFCHYQRKWANQPEALNMNINKAFTVPKRKHRLKEKVCVNAKA